jgi:hypothetical protein
MTTEREVSPEKKFVPALLPWLVAAGALAVYFVTLNRWVSLSSLQQVARLSGWTWQPALYGPLFWLVTYPFRWLPAQAIPLALNPSPLSAAPFPGAVGPLRGIGARLLARSAAEGTQRVSDAVHPRRLVPPVLAALVCNLQLSF